MKKQYEAIFYDLDGTLTDSGPGIRNSVAYALDKLGIPVADKTSLNVFIGPPLRDSFHRYYGLEGERLDRALLYYREYYTAGGIYENSVYAGITALLEQCARAGKRQLMATSKPEKFAKMIASHYGIDGYFDKICGASMDESMVEKGDIIRYALRHTGIPAARILMVGDRQHDILGARENHLDSAGVLWGFGSRQELKRAGADWLLESPEELGKLIVRGRI